MSAVIAVIAIGGASYLFRLGPLVALSRISLPTSVDRALGYAGPSAMTALTVTAVVHQYRTTDAVTTLGALFALGIGGWLAVRKHSFLTAVTAGLALFGGWLAVVPS